MMGIFVLCLLYCINSKPKIILGFLYITNRSIVYTPQIVFTTTAGFLVECLLKVILR